MAKKPNLWQRIAYRLWAVPLSPKAMDRSLLLLGSLKQLGWCRSAVASRPVGPEGEPLPWLPYPVVHWLETVLRGDERVFEYGTGHSTLWFADRAREVIAVENDPVWFRRISKRKPRNVTLILRQMDRNGGAQGNDQYVDAIEEREPFDIVVVDVPIAPTRCVESAARCLTPDGMVILDNADRESYRPAIDHLQQIGFWRLDFFGTAPGEVGLQCTSVFSSGTERWMKPNGYPRRWTSKISSWNGP